MERLTKPDGTVVEKFDRRVKAWTGLAWILERRHKPQFNKTDTHAITDPQGGGLMSAQEMADLERMTKAFVAELDNRISPSSRPR